MTQTVLLEQAVGARMLRVAIAAKRLGHKTLRGHLIYLHGDSDDLVILREFAAWSRGDASARDRLIEIAARHGLTEQSLLESVFSS